MICPRNNGRKAALFFSMNFRARATGVGCAIGASSTDEAPRRNDRNNSPVNGGKNVPALVVEPVSRSRPLIKTEMVKNGHFPAQQLWRTMGVARGRGARRLAVGNFSKDRL